MEGKTPEHTFVRWKVDAGSGGPKFCTHGIPPAATTTTATAATTRNQSQSVGSGYYATVIEESPAGRDSSHHGKNASCLV